MAFPGILNGGNHSLHPAHAETAGYQNAAHAIELIAQPFFFNLFGIHKTQIYPAVVGDAAVDALLRVPELPRCADADPGSDRYDLFLGR